MKDGGKERKKERQTEYTRSAVPSVSAHSSNSSHAQVCEKNWLQSFRKRLLLFSLLIILHRRRVCV